ncbi:Oxidase ustYa [Pseudocercospora fuligena]|uniref:Oxidase ustYa n=1 Tax=Pseudocercospora fuligena TaxID=685502 RepID=A0A8H6RFQ7_9PEZI|nr:Oxidase ustYa [Pseudocercospora fuligena]
MPLREEEEEKLLYNDEQAISPTPRQRRAWYTFSAFSYLTNAFLISIILWLLISRKHPHPELASDINNIWPKFPNQIIEFQPNPNFTGNLTSPNFIDSIKKPWLSLVPKGLGFIEVPNHPNHPNMPPPLREYKIPTYTTSVTHQLHCLFMIMHGMNDLALNQGSFAARNENGEGLTREGEDPAEHLNHCFDYLRQAIMCHGDTALEGAQTTFGEEVGGSDGWNVKHVCKPWDKIHDWLEERRIDDREWI